MTDRLDAASSDKQPPPNSASGPDQNAWDAASDEAFLRMEQDMTKHDDALDVSKWMLRVEHPNGGGFFAHAAPPGSTSLVGGWTIGHTFGATHGTEAEAQADLALLKGGVEDMLNRLNGGLGVGEAVSVLRECHEFFRSLGNDELLVWRKVDDFLARYDKARKEQDDAKL